MTQTPTPQPDREIAIVAAVSDNGVIGRDNDLPWRLPDDMKFFMHLTRGHVVIMGRRTYESMSGPLPNRRNIVISRNKDWVPATGVDVARSLDQALAMAQPEMEGRRVYIVGGAGVYEEALTHPAVTRMYLTHVHAQVTGDTRFPEIDPTRWRVVHKRDHPADERHAHRFTFRTYERSL